MGRVAVFLVDGSRVLLPLTLTANGDAVPAIRHGSERYTSRTADLVPVTDDIRDRLRHTRGVVKRL